MARCEHRCEQCEEYRNSADGAVQDFISYEANRDQLRKWVGAPDWKMFIRFAKQSESFGVVVDRAAEAPRSVVAVMDGGELVFYKLSEMRVVRGARP